MSESLHDIKKTAIIALFSDDELFKHLVLKDGNALDIIYGIGTRAGFDHDTFIYGIHSRFF